MIQHMLHSIQSSLEQKFHVTGFQTIVCILSLVVLYSISIGLHRTNAHSNKIHTLINTTNTCDVPMKHHPPTLELVQSSLEHYQQHSGTIFQSLRELHEVMKTLDVKRKADENTTDMVDSLRAQISTLVTLHSLELEIWTSSLTLDETDEIDTTETMMKK